MTTAVNPGLQRALRRAAVAATRAPSVLDTQPWRIVVRRRSVEIHADRSRQLIRLDPDARSLIFSCGSALTNLVLALSADGVGTRVDRFPDPHRPDLVATVSVDPGRPPAADPLSAALRVAVIDQVLTRPPRLCGTPAGIAAAPAVLSVRADAQAEVEALVRESVDRLMSDASARAEIENIWLETPVDVGDDPRPRSLGVVMADGGSIDCWVRAGERYQAATLDYALDGVATVPVVPVSFYADLRDKLQAVLGTRGVPQLLFRAEVGSVGAPRRRRRLVDTLVEGA